MLRLPVAVVVVVATVVVAVVVPVDVDDVDVVDVSATYGKRIDNFHDNYRLIFENEDPSMSGYVTKQ